MCCMYVLCEVLFICLWESDPGKKSGSIYLENVIVLSLKPCPLLIKTFYRAFILRLARSFFNRLWSISFPWIAQITLIFSTSYFSLPFTVHWLPETRLQSHCWPFETMEDTQIRKHSDLPWALPQISCYWDRGCTALCALGWCYGWHTGRFCREINHCRCIVLFKSLKRL